MEADQRPGIGAALGELAAAFSGLVEVLLDCWTAVRYS